MGKGMQKKFDTIPTSTIVGVLAAEANLDEAWRDLTKAIGKVFEDQDNAKAWSEVERLKTVYHNRSMFLVSLVSSLLRSQNNA